MLDLVQTDIYPNDELKHWGVLGMKWGIRRFQNPDGSLTPEGRERYGVKSAHEARKLSYAKEYLVLKQKKNRTEKENERLKILEKGKKHFERSINDADYWEKMKDNYSLDEYEDASQAYQQYFNSTNYGKGMNEAKALMSIPTTIIGAAIDAGAIYAQFNLGSPVAFYGIPTALGLGIGANIGESKYEEKHLEELKKELNSNNTKNKNYEFEKHIVKNPKKELNDYHNRLEKRRKNSNSSYYRDATAVNSAAKKAIEIINEDKAYSMVFSNPNYYLNNGQWTFEGKTYGSVDGLVNALIKSDVIK